MEKFSGSVFDGAYKLLQKSCGRCAIDGLMVEGEAERELLADAESFTIEHDGLLADGSDTQNGDFRIIDHWCERVNAKAAKAGDGEY